MPNSLSILGATSVCMLEEYVLMGGPREPLHSVPNVPPLCHYYLSHALLVLLVYGLSLVNAATMFWPERTRIHLESSREKEPRRLWNYT